LHHDQPQYNEKTHTHSLTLGHFSFEKTRYLFI